MKTRLLKNLVFLQSSIYIFSFLIFVNIIVTLNVHNNLNVYAQQGNPCPQTMSTGDTYVDKQGCILPCSTSNTKGEIPAGCPQSPPTQLQSQSMQPPQLPLPPLKSDQSKQEQAQNGPFTNNNNNLNTFGPLDTEVKNRAGDKISPCANDLSGKWRANDGGVYYIAQKGDIVKWFGSTRFNDDSINDNAKGFGYANEAQGILQTGDIHILEPGVNHTVKANGTQIQMIWHDVQISDNHQQGSLVLAIDPSGSKLVNVFATGGFGPSEWTRKC